MADRSRLESFVTRRVKAKTGIHKIRTLGGANPNMGELSARKGGMPNARPATPAESLGHRLGKGLSVKDLQPKADPAKSAGLTVTRTGNGGGRGTNLKKGIVKKAVKAAVGAAIDPVGTFRVGKKIFKRKGQFMTRNDQ